MAVKSILNTATGNSNRRTLPQNDLLRALVVLVLHVGHDQFDDLMQEPVLPAEYLEDAIFVDREENESTHTNTMFEDVGCIGELFWTLNQVAHGSIQSVKEVLQTPTIPPEVLVQRG